MSLTVANVEQGAHLLTLATSGEGVRQKLEEAGRRAHGRVLRRACEIAGLNGDHAADALGVERSQFSRWLRGERENSQTWRFEQHPVLGPALQIAEAEAKQDRGEAVEIETVIRITRRRPWDGTERRRA